MVGVPLRAPPNAPCTYVERGNFVLQVSNLGLELLVHGAVLLRRGGGVRGGHVDHRVQRRALRHESIACFEQLQQGCLQRLDLWAQPLQFLLFARTPVMSNRSSAVHPTTRPPHTLSRKRRGFLITVTAWKSVSEAKTSFAMSSTETVGISSSAGSVLTMTGDCARGVPRRDRVDGVCDVGGGDSSTLRGVRAAGFTPASDAEALLSARERVRRCDAPAVREELRVPDAPRRVFAGRVLASSEGEPRLVLVFRPGVSGVGVFPVSRLCSARRGRAVLPFTPLAAVRFLADRIALAGERKSVGGFNPLPGTFSLDLAATTDGAPVGTAASFSLSSACVAMAAERSSYCSARTVYGAFRGSSRAGWRAVSNTARC